MLAARERLGVGRIVGEAISIFFRRIHFVVLLCILPELILNVIQMAAILVTNSVYEAENIETGIVYQIWQPIKRFAGLLLFSGFAGQMVYEMKNDGRIRIGGILSTGLRRLIPLSACALATGAFASLATFPIVFAIWIAGNSDEKYG